METKIIYKSLKGGSDGLPRSDTIVPEIRKHTAPYTWNKMPKDMKELEEQMDKSRKGYIQACYKYNVCFLHPKFRLGWCDGKCPVQKIVDKKGVFKWKHLETAWIIIDHEITGMTDEDDDYEDEEGDEEEDAEEDDESDSEDFFDPKTKKWEKEKKSPPSYVKKEDPKGKEPDVKEDSQDIYDNEEPMAPLFDTINDEVAAAEKITDKIKSVSGPEVEVENANKDAKANVPPSKGNGMGNGGPLPEVVDEPPPLGPISPYCYICRNDWIRANIDKIPNYDKCLEAWDGKCLCKVKGRPRTPEDEKRDKYTFNFFSRGFYKQIHKEFTNTVTDETWKLAVGSMIFIVAAFFMPWLLGIYCLWVGIYGMWIALKDMWRTSFDGVVSRAVEVAAERVQETAPYKVVQEVRQKVMDPMGMGTMRESAQNLVFGVFSTLSVTTVGVIIYTTYNFIKKKKKKILEGKTPVDLAPDYFKAIMLTLGTIGVAASIMIKLDSFIRVCKNISGYMKFFTERDTKKVARQGTVTQVRFTLSDVCRRVAVGEIKCSPSVRQALLASKYNYSGGVAISGLSELRDLIDEINEKVRNRYPTIGFEASGGMSIPDFKTPIGQALQREILSCPCISSTAPDLWLYIAQNWLRKMGTQKKQVWVNKVSIAMNGTIVEVNLDHQSQAIPHIVGFLQAINDMPDLRDFKLFKVEDKDTKFVVFADEEKSARETLRNLDEDMSLIGFMTLIRDYILENKLAMSGLFVCVLAVYLGIYYYYKSQWMSKRVQEGKPKNQTKGDHIAAANNQRAKDEWNELRAQRQALRDDLREIYQSRRADRYDDYHENDEFYADEIMRLKGDLSEVKIDIERIYNMDTDGGITGHTNQKKKNTWGDRALPNSMKQRKQKPEARYEGGLCKIVDCGRETKDKKIELCDQHYQRLIEKDTPSSKYQALSQKCIDNIRQIRDGEIDDYKACGTRCLVNITKTLCNEHGERKQEAKLPDVSTTALKTYKTKKGTYAEAVVKPSLPPNEIGKKTQESAVLDLQNADSVVRQVECTVRRPILPIYIIEDGKYMRNGVTFRAKQGGMAPKWYTAYHVTTNGQCYVRVDGNFKEVFYTKLSGDFGVSDCDLPSMGRCFKLTENNLCPEEVRMYTLRVSDDIPMLAMCSDGFMRDNEYNHTTDTFGAQCGSPYVANNTVYYVHGGTDGSHNYGFSVHFAALSDF